MIDFVLDEKLIKNAKEFGFEKIYPVKIVNSTDLGKMEGFVVVRAGKDDLRKVFESKRVSLVVGLESIYEEDDLHYRKSGLNQVTCKLAKKNKISVGFSFGDVLNARERGKVLGRMLLNVRLCKKYKVNMVLGSFAKDKYEMRWGKDLEAFGRVIGIDKLDNKKIFKLKEDGDIKVKLTKRSSTKMSI